MAIQIVKHVPATEHRKGGFIHALPNGLLAPNIPTLFKNTADILAALGPDNLTNIYFCVAHHTGLSRDNFPSLPMRTGATFEYQTVIAWDLDKTDQLRSFEYLAAVARVIQTPPETLRLVTSGNGVHVYANLKHAIRNVEYFKANKPAYNEICRKIEAELKAAGLPIFKVDPTIFEPARVLRMPGTLNSKPGLPVTECLVLQDSEAQIEINLMVLSGLDQLAQENVSPEQIRRLYPTPDLQEVVKECRFVAACLESPEKLHEPEVFDVMGILAAMPSTATVPHKGQDLNARELAQAIFNGATASASLARQTFEDKWSQGVRYGTRKCSTIASRWSDECKSCPHRSRIPTPLALKSPEHIGSESTGFWVMNAKGDYSYPHYSDLAKVYKKNHRYVTTQEGRLFVYADAVYKPTVPVQVKAWVEQQMLPSDPLREAHRIEFLKKIEAVGALSMSQEEELFKYSVKGRLNCRNGVLDILTGELLPTSDKYGFQYVLPYDYAPEQEPEFFLDWLALVTEDRPELMEAVLDLMAYCLWPNYDDHVFTFLIGEGGNGKSTLIHIIAAMVGLQNFSAVGIEQLTTNRFAPAQLEGKLVNLSEESSGYELSLEACNMIKQISDGGTLQVERKGVQGYNMQNTAKLIFSANHPPRFKDQSQALKRRLLVIPFDYQIPVRDSRVEEKLIAEVPAIMGLLVRRIQQNYRENGRFVVSRGGYDAEAAQQKVLDAGDTVLEFIKEHIDSGRHLPEEAYIVGHDAYKKYTQWCDDNGHKYPANRDSFGKRFSKTTLIYGHGTEIIKIAGVSTRVYKRAKWKEEVL